MAGVKSPNVGEQTKAGDYLRKIDNGQNGGRQGPILVLASLTIPSYGASPYVAGVGNLHPNTDDLDCFLACDATAGAIVVTLPPAASTPLGTTIGGTKIDASGNTVTLTSPDVNISTGATTQTVARGVTTRLTLMDDAGTLLWVKD